MIRRIKMENKNILTGFTDLDAATGGFKRGDLILLTSRPAQGKTALALDIAYNVAVMQGLAVALFSLEMAGEAVYKRMAGAAAKIPIINIKEGMLRKAHWKALTLKIGELIKAPLFICDKPNLEVKEIQNNIEKLIEQGHKPELIVIDYFDLIKQENKQDAIANMQALKKLAVKLNIPFLVCSQMYRKKEGEPNRPEISDLRYPKIADIADLVLLLHWEYYYTQDESQKNSAEILIKTPVQKEIELKWYSEYCSFSDMEKPGRAIDEKEIEKILKKHWHPAKHSDRSKYNLEILEEVKKFLEKQPDMRFIQALWALNIVDKEDRFYEEPQVTLEKVKSALEKIQKGK